jgi:hypothetical protein
MTTQNKLPVGLTVEECVAQGQHHLLIRANIYHTHKEALYTIDTPIDFKDGRGAVEASTAGLAPGHWPMAINVGGVSLTQLREEFTPGGELAAVIYISEAGRIRLTIFND